VLEAGPTCCPQRLESATVAVIAIVVEWFFFLRCQERQNACLCED
jgi:hypothetical protein